MKKLLFFLLISVGLKAQFNYQAIVKDSDGNPVTNNQVKFKFSLMYLSSTATPVFVEEHDITTPADGVVNLSVGGGTVVNGTFSNIDWSQSVFMKEELDTGNGYQDMGTRQIASVPVAEYAKEASTIKGINLELKNTYIATSAVETITSQSLTALGFDALKNKTTGNGDTAIGRSALGKTTSGNNNTAVGTFSLGENIEGSKNTAVGLNALRSITNQSNNTAVGYRAGYGSTTFSGNSNTFIGNETSLGLEQVNNATAIGADATVTASNTIQLGNVSVTLVNTSGVVSATGFKGNGDEITLTNSDTVVKLLDKIAELERKIKSLELNQNIALNVGSRYGGGRVFYIFQEGDPGYVEGEVHGLVIADEDLDETRWTLGDVGSFTSLNISNYNDYQTSTHLNAGSSDTDLLIEFQENITGSFPAVNAAYNAEINGFDDWYLPSLGELVLIRESNDPLLIDIAFSSGYYWTSSLMSNLVGAMALDMNVSGTNGFCGCAFFESYKIRPIRKF